MRARNAPYVSLRHARTGRVGGEGRLPSGWRGEHTVELNVLDVNLEEAKASVVVNFRFDADITADFIGLCVGEYLAAPKHSVVVLAAEVTMVAWDNVEAARVTLREWQSGGELISQSSRSLTLRDTHQIGIVAHEVIGEERVTQPVLIVKRRSAAPGSMTVSLRGLAFGNLYDHPRWLWD